MYKNKERGIKNKQNAYKQTKSLKLCAKVSLNETKMK